MVQFMTRLPAAKSIPQLNRQLKHPALGRPVTFNRPKFVGIRAGGPGSLPVGGNFSGFRKIKHAQGGNGRVPRDFMPYIDAFKPNGNGGEPEPELEEKMTDKELKTLRMRRKKRRKAHPPPALAKRIIALPNRDKHFHESWNSTRDLMDFPHPFRMMLCAKPNCGKTTAMYNVVMRVNRSRKPFEKIYVVHCDPDGTKEYDDLDATMLSRIPNPKDFDDRMKTLVILEDLDYHGMDKWQKGHLERLWGYVSTHKNISCMLTSQNLFHIIPTIRRCSNIFVLWESHDGDMIRSIARKINVPKEKLVEVLETQLKNPHDSLWIDWTDESPAKFRINGYQVISVAEDHTRDHHQGVGNPDSPKEEKQQEEEKSKKNPIKACSCTKSLQKRKAHRRHPPSLSNKRRRLTILSSPSQRIAFKPLVPLVLRLPSLKKKRR